MGFETEGLDQLRLLLKRAANIPIEAHHELRQLAVETKEMARNMAPEQFGDLKDAIKMRSRDALGRFSNPHNGASFEIYVDGTHKVSDERQVSTGETTVGEYAWYIHEHMGWESNQMQLMPSQHSKDMGSAFGVEAGGKFLERASIEIGQSMNQRLGTLVRKHI